MKDLITGEWSGNVQWYRNIGTPGSPELTAEGFMMAGNEFLYAGLYSKPWVDDWNEDGLPDLLVGMDEGLVKLYINEGTSGEYVFNSYEYLTLYNGITLFMGYDSSPMVADLDGDGLKDLTGGKSDGELSFFRNIGTNSEPLLADPITIECGNGPAKVMGYSRPTSIDWNLDGAIDIVAGSFDGRLFLFLQTEELAPSSTMTLELTGSYNIPSEGGPLDFRFSAFNNYNSILGFDAWTEVRMPNWQKYGPLQVKSNLVMNPYLEITRDISQQIPGNAPFGYYYYIGIIGDYETKQVYDFGEFGFIKAFSGVDLNDDFSSMSKSQN